MEQHLTSELFCIDDGQLNNTFTEIEVMWSNANSVLLKAKCDGQWWVLKKLSDKHKDIVVYQNLLQKESYIQTQLNHANIAKAYGIVQVPGHGACLVIEWIDGINLQEWLALKPRRSERVRVFKQIIDALTYMHQHQVVHRDLKPENVMITRNGGNAKIIDFGLADADNYTELKQPSGTRGYTSPEQAKHRVTDCRNDIYSLGCMMADLRLGWPYNKVEKRCQMPLERRYRDASEVNKAIQRKQKWCRISIVVSLFVLLLFASWGIYMVQEENGRPRYEEVAQFRVANLKYTSWGGLAASVQVAEMKERDMMVPAQVQNDGLTYRVSELGFNCFKNDTLLQKLVVQCKADTMNILNGAFKGCNNLKQLYLLSKKRVGIGNDVWPCSIDSVFDTHHYADVTIYVPAAQLSLYKQSVWRRFKHIETVEK